METKQIYQMKASRIMTETLTGVIKNGTAQGLGLKNTISAGKTGTTNDKKDGWFVGYTPYYTTSVWVGYDMPKTVNDLKGSSYPGTIWHNFMEQIHDSSMKKKFELYDWRADRKAKLQEEKRQRELEEAQTKALEEEHEKEDRDDEPIVNVEPDNDTENTGDEDADTVIDENNDAIVNEPLGEGNNEGISEEEVSEDDTGEVTPSDEGAQSDEGSQVEEGNQAEEGMQSDEGDQSEEGTQSEEGMQ
jgi:membrane peptidoglycan carboxypeptidase